MTTLLLIGLAAAIVAAGAAVLLRVQRHQRDATTRASVRRRTNDALRLAAVALGDEVVEPPGSESGSCSVEVRGRRHGSAYTLGIVEDPRHADPTRRWILRIEIRHYGAVEVIELTGSGLTPPAVEPSVVRSRVEEACRAMVGTHT